MTELTVPDSRPRLNFSEAEWGALERLLVDGEWGTIEQILGERAPQPDPQANGRGTACFIYTRRPQE